MRKYFKNEIEMMLNEAIETAIKNVFGVVNFEREGTEYFIPTENSEYVKVDANFNLEVKLTPRILFFVIFRKRKFKEYLKDMVIFELKKEKEKFENGNKISLVK